MRYTSIMLVTLVVMASPGLAGDEPESEISDITWRLGPNLPEFRKGGCATMLGDQLVSVFGMRQPWGEMETLYLFDPHEAMWRRGPSGPIGQTYVQGTECQGAFYTIGGRSAPKGGVHRECYRLQFDVREYQWDRIATLVEPRAWAPSAAVDGRLFVFGGAKSGHGPTMGSVEMLDLAKNEPQWKKFADVPGPSRGWSAAAAAGGKLYLIGGSHFFEPKPRTGADRKRFAAVWQLDPITASWESKNALPYRVSGMDCCVYKDRYIIIVGGAAETADFSPEMHEQQQQDRYYKSYYCPFVMVYDTVADRWQRMPTRLPMPTNDIRVVITGNTLYAIGGENIEPATSNTTPWLRIGQIQMRGN